MLDDLHIVMYMPIEPNESIETFMTCERNKIIGSFTQHSHNDSWTLIHTICESTNVYLHDNSNMDIICGGEV
jgi:hypothetical protein